jgi:hypothetical protein
MPERENSLNWPGQFRAAHKGAGPAGRFDFIFPVEKSQKPLINLLGTPAEHKRHVIFEGAGHVPPRIDLIREVLDWLDRYLGPVGRTAD